MAELNQKEQDVKLMLASNVHLGTKNCDFQMLRYVYRRRQSGHYIINLAKTWEKLHLAARIIVAIENPQDIVVQSARPYAQRAVLKFAHYTGAKALAGRYTPGTFTNQIQKDFEEPRLLIVTDPRTDHQPIKESSYMSIPTIAFCDTDSCLPHVDVAIPANNKGKHSIGVLYWILSRMVLQMRGTISEYQPWDVMVDLFFYREPEETREEGADAFAAAAPAPAADAAGYGGANGLPAPSGADESWETAAPPAEAAAAQAQAEWAEGTPAGGNEGWEAAQPPVAEAPAAPAAAPGTFAPQGQEDFGAGF